MMKKNIFLRSLKYFFYILLIINLLILGCSCSQKELFSLEKTFIDTNWDFDNRIVTLEKELNSSDKPYKIFIELNLTQNLKIDNLPIVISLIAPDGAESHRSVIYHFKLNDDSFYKNTGNVLSFTKEVYVQKYFNSSGKYTFRILRKGNKYDLYGVQSVRLYAVPVKKQNKK